MPLGDFMPRLVELVAEATGGADVYEFLPEQPMEVPSVLFETPSGKVNWPRPAGPYYDLPHDIRIHCLFSRSDPARSDQAVRAWLEPIRAGLTKDFRPGWPHDPDLPKATAAVTKSGLLAYGPQVIEWGGVTYYALTITWRVEERYFDPSPEQAS